MRSGGRRAGSIAHASGVAALLCLLFVPRLVRADTLSYEAAPGCPSRETFVASVAARTSLARFEEGSRGRAFHVVLGAARARDEGPYLASLVVEENGKRSARDVDGTTCDEVADAVSLVVALTIDPNAKAVIAASPAPAPAPPIPRKNSAPVPPRPAPTTPPRSASYTTRIAIEGVVGAGVAPSTTVGAGLDLALERSPSQGAGPGLAFTFAAHARASFEKTVFVVATPSADTVRAMAVLSLCPLRGHAGPLVSELCGGVGAGLVRFEGEGAANPSAKMRFWSHLEGALVTTVSLGRATFFGIRASLEVPITRDELVFVRPEIFVHRASPVAGNLGAFVGLRL